MKIQRTLVLAAVAVLTLIPDVHAQIAVSAGPAGIRTADK